MTTNLVPAGDPVPFDVTAPIPGGTVILEASAGTGKTYAIAALAVRLVATGEARLDQLMLITFGRAATSELRDRVRASLRNVHDALAGSQPATEHAELVSHLHRQGIAGQARRRLRGALSAFDTATIDTTHGMVSRMLSTLGWAAGRDPGLTADNDDSAMIAQITADLYLARYANAATQPPLSLQEAKDLVSRVIRSPGTAPAAGPSALTGSPYLPAVPARGPATGDVQIERAWFAGRAAVVRSIRARLAGTFGFDDLLTDLAAALTDPATGRVARTRMREHVKFVLVDEFQDTDPMQWRILKAAFHGSLTLILVGDPKQSIYRFRGGDVHTYLAAADSAGTRWILDTNYRSDPAITEAVNEILADIALGDPRILVRPINCHHDRPRLAAAEPPVQLRYLIGDPETGPPTAAQARKAIRHDLVEVVGGRLDGGRYAPTGRARTSATRCWNPVSRRCSRAPAQCSPPMARRIGSPCFGPWNAQRTPPGCVPSPPASSANGPATTSPAPPRTRSRNCGNGSANGPGCCRHMAWPLSPKTSWPAATSCRESSATRTANAS